MMHGSWKSITAQSEVVSAMTRRNNVFWDLTVGCLVETYWMASTYSLQMGVNFYRLHSTIFYDILFSPYLGHKCLSLN